MKTSEKLVKRIEEECGIKLYQIERRPPKWVKKDYYTISWDGKCKLEEYPDRDYVHVYSTKSMGDLLKAKQIVAHVRTEDWGYVSVEIEIKRG